MSFVKFYLIFESFFLVKSLIFVFHACDLHNLHRNTHKDERTHTIMTSICGLAIYLQGLLPKETGIERKKERGDTEKGG